MTQGTLSLLAGCHQIFIHPLLVLIAWVKEYRSWPKGWELVCIFIHDIGHYGKEYLTHYEEKRTHWELGARLAGRLFGEKGFLLVAGHSVQSGYPRSKLFRPDKRSWLEAPDWWLDLNAKVEDFQSDASTAKNWKPLVRESLKNDCPNGLHAVYMEHKK